MTDEQRDSQSQQNVEEMQQAIQNNESKNLAIGCVAIIIIVICVAIGLWSCTACSSQESKSSTPATNPTTSGQSSNSSSSTGPSSSSTNTQPKQQTQPQQSQSTEQTFRQKITSLATTLSDLMNKEVDAFGAMDISASNQINDQAQKAYDDMEALSVPAGYEDIRNAYIEAGHAAAFAINYIHYAIGAKQVGDDSLCDYYVNLAETEQQNAISAMKNAAQIASATP